jgi:hypothetical protein
MALSTNEALGSYFAYKAQTANYLVNVSERHGLVYVETPKVGCTAIKRFLQEIEADPGTELPQNVHDKPNSPLKSPNNSQYSVDEILGSLRFTRFSFVRNPYSRVVSAYLDKIVTNQWEKERRLPPLGYDPNDEVEFIDFLKSISQYPPQRMDIHWMPQYTILRPDRINYEYLGRFEDFTESFRYLVEQYLPTHLDRVPTKNLAKHRTNADTRVEELIGPNEDALIRQIYEQDFKTFEYD